MDSTTNIQELKEKIKKFCDDRDWDQFHNAKELAIAMNIESSELLEHFRWKKDKEVDEMFKDKEKRQKIEDEMADVFYFLLRMSDRYNIDLSKALETKMKENSAKYPVKKFKGSAKKYNEI
jgi:NTP pyrophosphatase (non-canonical NTP hydrolase)